MEINPRHFSISRLLFVVMLVVLGLLALAAGGLYLWVNHFLASEEFRRTVSGAVSHALEVEGEFAPFRWSGFSVYSASFSGRGLPTSSLQEVKAEDLRADVSLFAMWRGEWRVTELKISQLRVTLQNSTPSPTAPETAPMQEEAGTGSARFLPQRFVLELARVENASLIWPENWLGGGAATGMEVKATAEQSLWEIHVTGGQWTPAKFPALSVGQALLRLRPDRLYLTGAELRGAKQGTVQVSGELGTRGAADAQVDATVRDFPLDTFLTGDWRAQWRGNVGGKFHFVRPADHPEAWTLQGSVRVDQGQVEALPLLEKAALLTRTRELRSFKLQTATADLTAQPDKITLSQIAVESEGLLRVEGTVTCTGEKLDGILQLGVTPNMLRFLPGARSGVFLENRGSYVWTPVKVGGTVPEPTEDLSGRLTTAAVNSLQDNAKGAVNSLLDLFNPLRK